ncbi:MAG: response regulator [bacterium]
MAKTYKILLVEDEPDLVAIFSMKLISEGFEVIVATNGIEGVRAVKEGRPDLVFLDMYMPDMDGYTAIEKIRADKEVNGTLIYAWSNLTQKKEIEKAIAKGVDGYIIKTDYTPSLLVDKVREILKIKK